MTKSIRELATELGQSIKADRAVIEAQAQVEARQREEDERRATNREAAFTSIFKKAKEKLGEAHAVLSSFSERPNSALRIHDAQEMIEIRQVRPREAAGYSFEVSEINGGRTVEDFVSLLVPVHAAHGHRSGAFSREIVNAKQLQQQAGRPVRTVFGDKIIACVHKNGRDGTIVFAEVDPLEIKDLSEWVSEHVKRMLVELGK